MNRRPALQMRSTFAVLVGLVLCLYGLAGNERRIRSSLSLHKLWEDHKKETESLWTRVFDNSWSTGGPDVFHQRTTLYAEMAFQRQST